MTDNKHYTVTLSSGRTLEVVEAGDPNGPAVIAHNGTPMGAYLFDENVEDAKKRGLRLISYARPGYGQSTRDRGRTVASAAKDTAELADLLEIEKFATWGISGGGPHVLACATLLPERVVAAAAISGIVPYTADGIDFIQSMGEMNIAEFTSALEGEDKILAFIRKEQEDLQGAGARELAKSVETILSDVDRALVEQTEIGVQMAHCMLDAIHHGLYGWADDDLAFIQPWGFKPATIRVPLQIWHGQQDLMAPLAHGKWLAEHIPQAEAHLNPEDGHMTMYAYRIPEVHAWLAKYF